MPAFFEFEIRPAPDIAMKRISNSRYWSSTSRGRFPDETSTAPDCPRSLDVRIWSIVTTVSNAKPATPILVPDAGKVVILPVQVPVNSGDSANSALSRLARVSEAVRAMDAASRTAAVQALEARFSARHANVREFFRDRYRQLQGLLPEGTGLDDASTLLVGAYFSHEYSYQAAAILSPSMVRHPDQAGLNTGDVRFILSTRCIGEGHISTIGFREGVVSGDGAVTLYPASDQALATDPGTPGADGAISLTRRGDLSQTVIFPATRAQSNGLEDLRLCEFDDGGRRSYIGTYTAFSGRDLRCERFETQDFRTFRLIPMRGAASAHKAMAFFPRKVNGRYAALGRLDNEGIYYLESNDLNVWEGGERILQPSAPWELMQIGNCGSPIELDEGWLVITHGVGLMRQYALAATLLDKADPRKILGRSKTPLLVPDDAAREGYVPNVVYSCGALHAGERIVVPYSEADTRIRFLSLSVRDILSGLTA